jgi:hypothetical protein
MNEKEIFETKPFTPNRIDVHSHMYPPEYVKGLTDASVGDTKAGREIARTCNEIAARMIGHHPERLGTFTIDYPFPPLSIIGRAISGIETHQGFDTATRSAIDRENALALFPGFGTKQVSRKGI